MTASVNWSAVRDACMRRAHRVGLSSVEAEDVAQDAIVLALEQRRHNEQRHRNVDGYCVVITERLAFERLKVSAREVELRSEDEHSWRCNRPEQEAHVAALHLAFLVRVKTRTPLVELIDGKGGKGRMARSRARTVVTGALSDE